MLYLLRSTERGKEPQAAKSKLRNDIADRVRAAAPEARLSFDVGRVYVESDRDLRAVIAALRGVRSFSPATACDLDDLTPNVLAVAAAALSPDRSFCVKIRRTGSHLFSSKQKAAELGTAILTRFPYVSVDLHEPDVEIAIEIRDRRCFLFTEVIPGLDAREPEPPEPTGAPRFLVDAMLGTLATRLRALGYDTEWRRDTADSLLLREATEQGRALLTQDRELAEIGGPLAYFVRGKSAAEQLDEVLERFALTPREEDLFTRCSVCNTPLVPVDKSTVESRVPPRVFAQYGDFWTCRRCDKIYWKGSHYEDMLALLYKEKSSGA